MMSDMQVIEQDTPAASSTSYSSSKTATRSKLDSFFDEFEVVDRESTGLEG
jgi:hypothetical protein